MTLDLRAEGLAKRFGSVVAVRHIDLEVHPGEVLALLGPNGAGKTTTIHMLCGLLRPDAGRVLIAGRPLTPGCFEARHLGVCPQTVVVWELLSCREQLVFVGALYGIPRGEALRRANRLLDDLQLAEKAAVQARKLSGGMQRRLNLALALVHDPAILFLDEPEAGLDPQSRVLVRDYIQRMATNKAIVLTTHNMDEASRVASRVAIVDRGAIVAQGTQTALTLRLGQAAVIEVDLLDAPSDEHCRALLELLRPLGGEATMHERTVMLRCSDATAQVAPLLQRLAAAGVASGDVRLRQPTLEDVFLFLTGRRLRDDHGPARRLEELHRANARPAQSGTGRLASLVLHGCLRLALQRRAADLQAAGQGRRPGCEPSERRTSSGRS